MLAGVGAGVVMLVVSLGLTIAYPSSVTDGPLSTLDLGILTLFDLHFIPAEGQGGFTLYHVIPPSMNAHFDEFRAVNAAFGVLHLLPAFLAYHAGKLASRYENLNLSVGDSVLAGASVVLGYLPVVVIAAVMAPSDTVSIDTATAIGLAGLVYPLLFGIVGGLVGTYYEKGELSVGMAYIAVVGFLSVVLTFVSTFLTIENIPEGAEEMLGRLITSVFALFGAFRLDLGASGTGLAPYAVLVLLFAGAGFLRVYRAPPVASPVEAVAKAGTLATTAAVFVGLVATVAGLLSSPYLVTNELPEAYVVVGAATESDALWQVFGDGFTVSPTYSEIASYVEVVLTGTVVYGVVVAGLGGAFAWYIDQGGRTEAPQPPRQQPR